MWADCVAKQSQDTNWPITAKCLLRRKPPPATMARNDMGDISNKKGLPNNRKAFSYVVRTFVGSYFTASMIALKASGWFIAKSANTLRFKPISLAANLPINCE